MAKKYTPPLNQVCYFNSDIDELVEKFRGKVSEALLNTASKFAKDARQIIADSYHFKNEKTIERVVSLRFTKGDDMAHIKIYNKSFSLPRLVHKAPNQNEPGYTDINYNNDTRGTAKMFPITLAHGSKVMVTRSGIKHITEGWQERQSAMTFAMVPTLDRMLPRHRETVFKTYERKKPRTHTFRIVRTLTATELIAPRLPKLLEELPINFVYELRRTKPRYVRRVSSKVT